MKALKKTTADGRARFVLQDVPDPGPPGRGEAQVAIRSIGICTSDVHVLRGAMAMPDGLTVGHEYSGVVLSVGEGAEGVSPGDRIISETAVGACFECGMCRSGHYELCPSKRALGWLSDGVYTERINVPLHCLHKVPESISFDVGAVAEPTAICVYGCIERAAVAPEDVTVIYGMGPIGLLTLISLKDWGVERIVCLTPTRHGTRRAELAKELGADHVLPSDGDIPAAIAEIAGGPVDCVVDCCGAPGAINEGMRLLRKGGKFVALGIASDDTIPFAWNEGVLRAVSLTFSCTSSREAWLKVRGILERRHDQVARIITHRFPLAQWREAFDCIERREAIKVVLTNEP